MNRQFYGKYRGRVESNVDPKARGRLQVSCPSVLGKGNRSWAMPCVPYAGKNVGWFMLPPQGASIWVEFEEGDPDYPIWSGCFWAKDENPADPAAAHIKVLKTEHTRLQIDDTDQGGGSCLLEIDAEAADQTLKILLSAEGIEINHGGERVIRLSKETIELVNQDQAQIKLTSEDIELVTSPAEIKLLKGQPAITMQAGSSASAELSSSQIEFKQNSATLTLSSSSAELACASSTATVNSQGVELGGGAATAKVAGPGIELNNGSGAAVKLSGPQVTVNNSALEVM